MQMITIKSNCKASSMVEVTLKIMLFLLTFYVTNIEASWRDDHERGWHWYEGNEEENEKKREEIHINSTPVMSYADKLKKYREDGEELRAKAVLERTPESVRALMTWEKSMWNNAETFGSMWQAVLRENPEFDYSVTHPTSQYSRHLYLDEQKKKVKLAIDALKRKYGLVFFFKESCAYCHAMAPIVASMASRHGFILHGISLDGSKLNEIPVSSTDNGLSQRFNVTMVPAIYAVDPKSGEYFPIATGAISEQEIEERIFQISEYQSSLGEQGKRHAP